MGTVPIPSVRPRGFEPLTFAAAGQRSNPLSYGRGQPYGLHRVLLRKTLACEVTEIDASSTSTCYAMYYTATNIT